MLLIRSAEMDDVPAIAAVHVDTWRTTYRGLIPQHYLDNLTVQNRSIGWVRLLEWGESKLITLVSEVHDGRVVGFVSGGPLRGRDRRFQSEISLLYVQPAFQRAGHGRRLFLAASNRLACAGYKGLMVWVLAENPSRRFYEALGGEVVAETTRMFAGVPLREVAYGWEEIPRYET
jgi:ribosomal protein S18 acetylase RimI-like enzyme